MRQTIVPMLCLLSAPGQGQLTDKEDVEDPLQALAASIPGTPGTDYPIFSTPPETSFLCDGYVSGYYADTEAKCQAFHVCVDGGRIGQIKYTFLCPNGTLFNQNYFTCDWWFNVDCEQSVDLYSINFDREAERKAEKIDLQGRRSDSSESQSSSGTFVDLRNEPFDYTL